MPVYNQSRSRIIQIIFLGVFLVIIVQLMNLQLFSSDFKIMAENNARYRKVIYPNRGIIYDKKHRAILENTIMYDLIVTPSETKGLDTSLLCNILGIDTAEYRKKIITSIIKNSSYKPSVFAPLVSPEVYARLNENMYKFPGFLLTERPIRTYPYHVAAGVLGYLGEVDSGFLRKHDGEGYEPGDYAGMTGLERSYEKVLMGQRGIQYFIRDNRSRLQGTYENGKYDTLAVAGRNLYTSMDVELQQLAEKLFKNKIGSVVAIDPQTGGILAMATSPTYDPNVLSGAARKSNFGRLIMDTARPLLNRAIKGQYPPGSTFKPMGALIALDEGLITPSYGYPCYGGYYACGRGVKCTHSDPGHAANLRLALANSCNSYFCQIFRMVIDNPKYKNTAQGYLVWKKYMNDFGMGTRSGIDLPSEDKGNIPDTAQYNRDFGGFARWNSCNILTLGIGQDRMLVTPLQMANLMAIIANKGSYFVPHFVDSIENQEPEDSVYLDKYKIRHTVTHISDSDYNAVQLGMLDVTEFGTATNVQIPGVEICAKTGTAQNPHGKNHSIFVAFAPRQNPKIAIAVVVENAGYGATWAAPIASLMMEKYLNDTIATNRLPEVERISKADLIPAEIKHWYYMKDSIKQEKLAKQIDLDTVPVFQNNLENKKITFDPEAEPNRKDSGGNDTIKIKQDMLNQQKKNNKKP
ncbi:MAG: penicillin-binding protein 2 [Chitinophagaceae bacterium]